MEYLDFIKMHGIGNDFILIDGRNKNLDYKNLALDLCQRHYSIGADGLIILENSKVYSSDYKMKIINTDGTEAEMCGNGIRTLTHFIKFLQRNNKNKFSIETKAGIIKTEVISYQKEKSEVKVNMGTPKFSTSEIPANISNKSKINNYKITVNKRKIFLNSLSFGNPHTVIFVKDLDKLQIKKIGKTIENHKIFPDRTNVEFVKIEDYNTLKVRVWERGVGETLACGTGACASAVISNKKGYTSDKVKVKLKGGNLKIEIKDKYVMMSGESELVYKGTIKI